MIYKAPDAPVIMVWVQFEIDYVVQHEGHAVAISGSIPQLGQWSVLQAVLAGNQLLLMVYGVYHNFYVVSI